MSLILNEETLLATSIPALELARNRTQRHSSDRALSVKPSTLTNTDLQDLISAAETTKDTRTRRAAEAILTARQGNFNKTIPNFSAFQGILEQFLKHDIIDGWIYATSPDGALQPELVTSIRYREADPGHNVPQAVEVNTIKYGLKLARRQGRLGLSTKRHVFEPSSVVRRTIADALAAKGIYKETPELKADYLAMLTRHENITMKGFAEQFRASGRVYAFEEDNYARRHTNLENRKVIHDLTPEDYDPLQNHTESELMESGTASIPEHPLIRVFDLVSHEYYWMHSDNLTRYQYDQTLRDKFVLPASHRDLLDVLTTDLSAFIGDIIEGKSAGNVILCKGIAGVGKTLTAEIYSELIERPLYAIHSGNLGTTVGQISTNLQTVFNQAKRWNCALLLDEADVFVVQRGNNIEQNAIVAEFLRTLEYFDGLLFMTTNRPDDIDEAIISRCAAIIHYETPKREDAAAIWRIMGNHYDAPLEDDFIAGLLQLFPTITPRDIKMLFRLALRVSAAHNKPLTLDVFRQAAMFRAIQTNKEVSS